MTRDPGPIDGGFLQRARRSPLPIGAGGGDQRQDRCNDAKAGWFHCSERHADTVDRLHLSASLCATAGRAQAVLALGATGLMAFPAAAGALNGSRARHARRITQLRLNCRHHARKGHGHHDCQDGNDARQRRTLVLKGGHAVILDEVSFERYLEAPYRAQRTVS
jgi:hypothetical protein